MQLHGGLDLVAIRDVHLDVSHLRTFEPHVSDRFLRLRGGSPATGEHEASSAAIVQQPGQLDADDAQSPGDQIRGIAPYGTRGRRLHRLGEAHQPRDVSVVAPEGDLRLAVSLLDLLKNTSGLGEGILLVRLRVEVEDSAPKGGHLVRDRSCDSPERRVFRTDGSLILGDALGAASSDPHAGLVEEGRREGVQRLDELDDASRADALNLFQLLGRHVGRRRLVQSPEMDHAAAGDVVVDDLLQGDGKVVRRQRPLARFRIVAHLAHVVRVEQQADVSLRPQRLGNRRAYAGRIHEDDPDLALLFESHRRESRARGDGLLLPFDLVDPVGHLRGARREEILPRQAFQGKPLDFRDDGFVLVEDRHVDDGGALPARLGPKANVRSEGAGHRPEYLEPLDRNLEERRQYRRAFLIRKRLEKSAVKVEAPVHHDRVEEGIRAALGAQLDRRQGFAGASPDFAETAESRAVVKTYAIDLFVIRFSRDLLRTASPYFAWLLRTGNRSS